MERELGQTTGEPVRSEAGDGRSAERLSEARRPVRRSGVVDRCGDP
jgi:hypothetical protein